MNARLVRKSPGAGNAGAVAISSTSPSDDTSRGPLFQEFVESADVANRREVRQWLAAHGVPLDMLYHGGNAIVGVSRIDRTDEPTDRQPGTYQPHDDGVPAVLIAVCDITSPIFEDDGSGAYPLDTLHDIVAWLPGEPGRLYLRTGDADLLNPEAVTRAWHLNKPLIVHATVLEWLQGRGAGCVVLDWRKPLPMILHNCQRILCGDKATTRRLMNGMKAAIPEIREIREVDHG